MTKSNKALLNQVFIKKIQKNSAVVIPKGFKEALNLKEDDNVKVSAEGNKIIIEKVEE